jgi:hypothetical protein
MTADADLDQMQWQTSTHPIALVGVVLDLAATASRVGVTFRWERTWDLLSRLNGLPRNWANRI